MYCETKSELCLILEDGDSFAHFFCFEEQSHLEIFKLTSLNGGGQMERGEEAFGFII